MFYYFDVKLNFLDKYYYQYEWSQEDRLHDVKRIPIFKILPSDFIKIFTNSIKVEEELIKKICNKTIIDNGLLKYSCIFTDGNSSIVHLFNENGESILYSSLALKDEVNIEELTKKIKYQKINFEEIKKIKLNNKSRVFENKKNFINKEIEKLKFEKNLLPLKYICKECNIEDCEKLKKYINESELNFLKIYKILKNLSKKV